MGLRSPAVEALTPPFDELVPGSPQRLGRQAASYTLDTYIHLLDEDIGEPLPLYGQSPVVAITSADDQLVNPA